MNLAMNADEFAQLPETGLEGIRPSRPVPGPRHMRRRTNVIGGDTSADASVRAWENAYRRYGRASELSPRTAAIDSSTARQMATASRAVAAAWRQIAQTAQLPWWSLAAVESAAQAFEAQARDWEAREGVQSPADAESGDRS